MSTVTISAADVNNLRKKTGAGMMDCKSALREAGGDFEKAIEILRKKGQKVADKRSDREATEGYAVGKISADGKNAIIVALNCETDFVAKNEEFVTFAENIANIAITNLPETTEELIQYQIEGRSIADLIIDYIGKIGEKIEVSYYQKITAEVAIAYNHPGNRVVSIVGLNKKVDNVETIGRDVAMQIAAMNPISINKDSVPQDVIEKEIEIAKELLRKEGKPEDKIDMIAQGKLGKFFKESTLLEQDFIKDSKISVEQYLKGADKELTVVEFRRYSLSV
jgi:elongation factor Ts